MMSVSPPGQQSTSDQGGSRTLTPGGHGLLRTACLPFHHLAISAWARRCPADTSLLQSPRRDSNPQPPASDAGALAIALLEDFSSSASPPTA